MKTTKDSIQKNAMTDLAWKELIAAIKPENLSASKTSDKKNTNKIKHHPAIITTSEMSNWEIFG